MLVADMSSIKLINLDGGKKTSTLWEGIFGDYTGLVYDQTQKRVYFSDSNR